MFKKNINTFYTPALSFLMVVYLYFVNFNLPFMTVDEMVTIINFNFNVFDLLNQPRPSALASSMVTNILMFESPTLDGLVPRFLSMLLLFSSLIFLQIHYSIDKLQAVTFAFLSLILFEIDWQHNGLVSYFGAFNVYLALFIIAIIFYEKYENIFNYISVTFLLILSFGTELFFGFSIIYIIIRLFQDSKKVKILVSPFMVNIFIYLSIFLYSKIGIQHPLTQKINDYVVGSFFDYSTLEMIQGYFIYLSGIFSFMPSNIYFGVLFFFIIIVGSILYIIKASVNEKFYVQRQFIFFIFSLALILLPALLMTLQPMKLMWALDGASDRYTFSLYSWIGCFLYLSLIISKIHIYEKKTVLKFLAIPIFLFSVYSIYENLKFIKRYEYQVKYLNQLYHQLKNSQGNTVSVEMPVESVYISIFSEEYFLKYAKILFKKDLDFLIKNFKLVSHLEGFSTNEADGRWIVAQNSKIFFKSEIRNATSIHIYIQDVFYDKEKTILLSIGNQRIKKQVKIGDVIKINLRELEDNRILKIDLKNLISPKSKNLSGDERELGIKVSKILVY